MKVDLDRCIGCGICAQDCPLEAIHLKKKRPVVDDRCTRCAACVKICPEGALSLNAAPERGSVQCDACPIGCWIKEGHMGACHRYRNLEGRLQRITPLHPFSEVEETVGPGYENEIRQPLVTGIGAGTTYPDCKPAPVIVRGNREGVDVVTVVTEAPLSYSSILVKIDTDIPVGEEGAAVKVGKRKVGMVATEQYGSKMLSIGGVNLMTGRDGLLVAKAITRLANKLPVKLKVQGGSRLVLQVGKPPIIEGEKARFMRVGCGSATLGLFALLFKDTVDEAIVLDSHLTGLMTEHEAGRFVGAKPSGIKLAFRQSTPGRYFGDHGKGWGGTSITRPLDSIADIDYRVARPGMQVLITETTGQKAGLFELGNDGRLHEVDIPKPVKTVLAVISSSCEPSLVSAIYMGGAGGSARAGVARYPVKLTHAVQSKRARLTVGGAPTFLLPGGGINFMVDVLKVKGSSFYWTPTPATICPIEYTMTLVDYKKIGGHVEAVRPFSAQQPVPSTRGEG